MAFIGIDPGAKGGLAMISASGAVLNLRPTPTIAGKFNVRLFAQALKEMEAHAAQHGEGIDLVIIEQVGAMPGNGVTAMFSFGYGAGAIEGILSSFQWPYQLVRPQLWQKDFHVGTSAKLDAKARSILAAQRLFPKESFLASSRSTKPHDGIIDAALMAEFGRRSWRGTGASSQANNHLPVFQER